MEATLHNRAAGLAGELSQLRDAAYQAGDVELHAELQALDRTLHGTRGQATTSSYHALAASLEESSGRRSAPT